MRVEKIDLEFENYQLKTEFGPFAPSTHSLENMVQSAPTSLRTSPLGSMDVTDSNTEGRVVNKSYQLMNTMHKCLNEKSREISQLKNLIEVIDWS
jgi:hypothetical protein